MKIKISDHALVRWLERVHNIDTERLKAHVLSEHQKEIASKLLGSDFVIKNGVHRFVFKRNTLITVVNNKK